MKAKQQLRPPENWQDFESLCKMLWGEIWNCPEIVKNGRQGQPQCGVDVYGIPSSESEYYGIQCKGKDNYTHKQFSETEIDEEIKKAKSFKPKLKKFYLATTAVKDASIEEYVRIKNTENIKSKLFSIHIFSWEDIVDLIDQNRRTHDWYVKSQNFKQNQSAKLTFHDNSDQISLVVPFVQKVTDYKQKIVPANPALRGLAMPNLHGFAEIIKVQPVSLFNSRINHSYCKFFFRLHNSGTDPIEEFKVFLTFEGEFASIDTVTKGGGIFSPRINYTYDTFIDNENKTGKIIPDTNILVGEDSIAFDDIAIKPIHEPSTIIIKWKLVSRDYKNEGELTLNIIPEIRKEYKTVLVEDPLQVKIVEGNIEDYITESDGK